MLNAAFPLRLGRSSSLRLSQCSFGRILALSAAPCLCRGVAARLSLLGVRRYFSHLAVGRLRVLGPEHPYTLGSMGNLANVLYGLGKLDEAEVLLREFLEAARSVLPDRDPAIARALSDLGVVLTDQAEYEEAERLLLEANTRMTNSPDAPPDQVIDTLEGICKLYEAWEAADPGKGYTEKAAEWRAKLRADSDAPSSDAAHQPDAP